MWRENSVSCAECVRVNSPAMAGLAHIYLIFLSFYDFVFCGNLSGIVTSHLLE